MRILCTLAVMRGGGRSLGRRLGVYKWLLSPAACLHSACVTVDWKGLGKDTGR